MCSAAKRLRASLYEPALSATGDGRLVLWQSLDAH
jgi:hypothetical protein